MSIFQKSDHRITAARTYFQIAKINVALFHERKNARLALEATAYSEDEQAAVFQKIEDRFEGQWHSATIAITFAGTFRILAPHCEHRSCARDLSNSAP